MKKIKQTNEKNIIREVKKGFEENIVVKTEMMNKMAKPLSPELLRKMNAYWQAANYLSVGQIYLYVSNSSARRATSPDRSTRCKPLEQKTRVN